MTSSLTLLDWVNILSVSFLGLVFLTLRTYAKERHMAVDKTISARFLQPTNYAIQRFGLDLKACSARLADQMMMISSGDLINKLSIIHLGRNCQPVLFQKFQRAIDGRFRQAGRVAVRFLIDFGRRKMRTGMMKHMQDRHPLWSHAEAACPQPGAYSEPQVIEIPYCKFLQ